MKKKKIILILFFFVFIVFGFFYKAIIYKYVPFPGDLLVSEYNPWKSYSFLGYNPGSYPNKAQYFDTLRQIYPWKTFSINSLKNISLPLWNPYNFSGAPLLANFQSAVFYPFNFLYFLLPQIWAWSSLVMLQPFLALLFTFFYCRKIGISPLASIFAGISFAFSSFMTVWLEYNTIGHAVLWLPLILLSLEKLLEKKSVIWSLILVIAITSSLFAGHVQIFTYLLIFVLVYSFARIRKISLFLISLFTLSLGIGAVQLVPGIELIMQAARTAHAYDLIVNKILIQPWQLVMLFVPDFFGNPATRNYWPTDTYIGKITYVGVIPLFFVLLSFKYLKNSLIRFFGVAAGAVLILASLNPITIFLYKFNLPFISASAPTLSIFLFCFCMSLLSGFGIDIWRREKQGLAQVIRLVSPVVLIIIFLWIIAYFVPQLISDELRDNIVSAHRNLLLATFLIFIGIFLIIIGTLKKKLIYVVLIVLFIVQTGDLFRFFTKFNPFVPKDIVFPSAPVFEFLKKESGIDRFWGYGTASIEANFATQYSLFSPDGYDPLYPKRYGEFIQSSKKGKIVTSFTTQTRSDANIAHGFGELDFPSNEYRLKVLDLLGVKYILDRVENKSTENTFSQNRFKLIYHRDGWKIFENLNALPRAFLVSDYRVFNDKEEFEKIFFDNNFDSSKTLLLEEKVDMRLNDLNHLSKTKILSYSPNKIIVDVNTDINQFLFLSDTYYPGWKAFVDDQEAKIYRANHAFRAVFVPRGQHKIKFVYDPDSYKIGLRISAISFILTFVLLTFFFIRPKSVTT